MRKKLLQFVKKLEYRFRLFYTWLLRSSFKECGSGVVLHCPLRLDRPDCISLGANVTIYPRAWLNAVMDWEGIKYGGEIRIGNGVGIGYGVQISAAKSIIIEDEVMISSDAVIVDHLHDHRQADGPIFFAPLSEPKPVHIAKHSFLGVHCFVGPGVRIGEHAVVAANAVVVNDVPAYSMAIGNPARCVRFKRSDDSKTAKAELTGVDCA